MSSNSIENHTLPYTERSNEITRNIDVSNPTQMVDQLCRADLELFTGPPGCPDPTLYNENILQTITAVTNHAIKLLTTHDPNKVRILLSGCGTSGRLAYYITTKYNNLYKSTIGCEPFKYAVSGDDLAIMSSVETPEDDPDAGILEMKKASQGKDHVLFIGISCQLQAPYVVGQLEHCMANKDKFVPVLMGFNPIHLLRPVVVPDWSKTCKDVIVEFNEATKKQNAYIINPVIGPEGITGSSKMKGGSTTKYILEAIMLNALDAAIEHKSSPLNPVRECTAENTLSVLKGYESVNRTFYAAKSTNELIPKLISRCGYSLRAGGHMRYLASGSYGIMGLVDATECPPTYGAHINDVRGFVVGGYKTMELKDCSGINPYLKIDPGYLLDMYEGDDLDAIKNDTIVVLIESCDDPTFECILNDGIGERFKKMIERRKSLNGENGGVVAVFLNEANTAEPEGIKQLRPFFDDIYVLPIPSSKDILWPILSSTVKNMWHNSSTYSLMKWAINALSSGAHVLAGKVYQNYMCDVRVRNNKLYLRGIRIVRTIVKESDEKSAEDALLKSIYERNDVEDVKGLHIGAHVHEATPKDKVVPKAIIMAKLKCSLERARQMLDDEPIVREALARITGGAAATQ